MANRSTRWMTRLALRDNFFQVNEPHIPILVEDLPKYIALTDYEKNCVKSVQTIGIIESGFITSITPGSTVRFPCNTNYMSPFAIYHSSDEEGPISEAWTGPVVRVFGFLNRTDDGIVLRAIQVADVEDVKESLHTLILVSRLARRQYRQYSRTEEMNELLRKAWVIMRKNKTRR